MEVLYVTPIWKQTLKISLLLVTLQSILIGKLANNKGQNIGMRLQDRVKLQHWIWLTSMLVMLMFHFFRSDITTMRSNMLVAVNLVKFTFIKLQRTNWLHFTSMIKMKLWLSQVKTCKAPWIAYFNYLDKTHYQKVLKLNFCRGSNWACV